MNFKRNIFAQIQQDVIVLTEEYLTPSLLLGIMFKIEFVPLLGAPSHINIDLETFGRRNLWHGAFTKSFCTWIFNKHRDESWISKCSTLFTLALHQMWQKSFSTFDKSTCSKL